MHKYENFLFQIQLRINIGTQSQYGICSNSGSSLACPQESAWQPLLPSPQDYYFQLEGKAVDTWSLIHILYVIYIFSVFSISFSLRFLFLSLQDHCLSLSSLDVLTHQPEFRPLGSHWSYFGSSSYGTLELHVSWDRNKSLWSSHHKETRFLQQINQLVLP